MPRLSNQSAKTRTNPVTGKPIPDPRPESGIPEALRNFDHLPDSAGVRQPIVEALFACSSSTVWRRVESGLIPKPRKLGRTTVWNVGELRRALQGGE